MFVLGKGEDVIDVIDESLYGYSFDGGWGGFSEVLLIFLNEKISVVDEIAIELA